MKTHDIGEIAVVDDFGEALAYAVYCVRADKYKHDDHVAMMALAHQDMLRHGWQEDQLQEIARIAIQHGTYQVEADLYAATLTKRKPVGA